MTLPGLRVGQLGRGTRRTSGTLKRGQSLRDPRPAPRRRRVDAPVVQHDDRLHLLAERAVVDADDRGVGDVGVLDQPVLDLHRVDVLAAPDDQVAHAALEPEHAVLDAAVVAAVVPALVVEHLGGRLGVVPVAR